MTNDQEHNDGTGQPVRCSAWLGDGATCAKDSMPMTNEIRTASALAANPTSKPSLSEDNARLRVLLMDAALRICEHHAVHLCAWEGQTCPVCCDDLFERIDAAMGKSPNVPDQR